MLLRVLTAAPPQTICQEVLKKRSNDPVILFWKAFGMCMEGAPPVPPAIASPCARARPGAALGLTRDRRRARPGGKDSPNKAILQFEQLQNHNDVSLAATAACLFAHKRCRLVDQEAVEMLGFNVDSKQACAARRARPTHGAPRTLDPLSARPPRAQDREDHRHDAGRHVLLPHRRV